MLYGSPIDDNMDIFDKYQNPSDYFFDTDLLSENRPINVRGCRKCGRIGHLARHCPERKYEDQKKQLPSTPTKSQQQLSAQYKSQQQQAQYKTTKQHAVVSSQKQTSLVPPQKQQKPQTSQSQGNPSQRGQQNQTSSKDTERRERGQASQGAQGNSSANANKNQSPQAVSSGQLSDRLWPHRGKNQSSVAELWIGFLRFYVEDFNYKELVISIRQYAPLTRFEKLWNGSCLAIEGW
uniref:CCHC-type domain-containing protein n=1 Tax=Biomphalaria glabrata TaxID=6526 RepID=A0A2C9L988_BIOGL